MSIKQPIEHLTIKGFKSIKELNRLELRRLNVLIGSNGSGKSNFLAYFRMLSEMMAERLQNWTTNQGTSDRIVSFGVKETAKIESFVEFGLNGYGFELEPTVDGGFSFSTERLFFDGPYFGPKTISLGSGHKESKLRSSYLATAPNSVQEYCYSSISSWKLFHFHDTGDRAGVKRACAVQDYEYLRPDASNLAAYLFRLMKESPDVYAQIRKTIRLAIPFFDDFILKPFKIESDEELIRLLWKQRDSDYPLWPSQLSDGSLRFICLVTALLQPDPPATILIDEPELGLHPYAITLLAALLRSASVRMQVIVATQSVQLVNEFEIDQLIVVETVQGQSEFKRLDEAEFQGWLEGQFALYLAPAKHQNDIV